MHRSVRLLVGAIAASVLSAAVALAQPVAKATGLSSRQLAAPLLPAGEVRADSALTLSAPADHASPPHGERLAVSWQEVKPKSRKDAAPWWAPVASAILPGSGQLALGQQRGVAYLVAEVYLVVQAVSHRRDWETLRSEYQSIAADVARRQFGGDLPIGSWEYYESMQGLLEREGLESGIFDRVPGGPVDPEIDEETFNGGRWRIARETYWADPNSSPATTSPEYQLALAEYERTAVRDEYRWSWRDAQLARGVYRETIASSNRSYQRSVSMASLVGMNHLVSLIDAYVTTRIRRFGSVKAVGMSLEGIESGVRAVGDPAARKYRLTSTMRFVPTGR